MNKFEKGEKQQVAKKRLLAGLAVVLISAGSVVWIGQNEKMKNSAVFLKQTESIQANHSRETIAITEKEIVNENFFRNYQADKTKTEEMPAREKVVVAEKVPHTKELFPVQEPAGQKALDPAAEKLQTNLQFASREEAIQFGMSRFTAEELALFKLSAANGLTPEQKEMALQIAYSRFTPEEIAAIKAALGR